MRCVVLGVWVVALVMQLGGAGFVIVDVIRNSAAMRKFLTEWQRLTTTQGLDWPHFKEPVLAELLTTLNESSGWRRWTPVALLIAGVILGFAGNALSLYVPAS